MSVYASVHFNAGHHFDVWEREGHSGVRVGSELSCFCDDAETADRMSEAFALLASKMRAAANLPDPDQLELVDVANTEDAA